MSHSTAPDREVAGSDVPLASSGKPDVLLQMEPRRRNMIKRRDCKFGSGKIARRNVVQDRSSRGVRRQQQMVVRKRIGSRISGRLKNRSKVNIVSTDGEVGDASGFCWQFDTLNGLTELVGVEARLMYHSSCLLGGFVPQLAGDHGYDVSEVPTLPLARTNFG